MRNYLNLLNKIMREGVEKRDRTGVGTYSLFGEQLRFDLREGFPLLTTKRVYFRAVVAELLWFLSGSTNNNDLTKQGVTIWNEWARADGDLGPIYGYQWRKWGYDPMIGSGIDQIAKAIDLLKRDPDSRRNVVSAWNVADLPDMALAPCHCLFQLYVTDGKVSLHLYQRSADIFLGVPFNIAAYALLCRMFAHVSGLEPGELIISFGDVHLYKNHVEQAQEQLRRTVRPLPQLLFRPGTPRDIFAIHWDDPVIHGYNPHPAIKAPVAV